MFRSGSTLTEQVLAGHSRVTAGGEIGFLPSLVRTAARAVSGRDDASDAPGNWRLLGARLSRDAVGRLFPGAAHVTTSDRTTFSTSASSRACSPNARIVHTTRNPLDNCLSIFFLHLDHSMGYALDLMDTAHYYAQYRRLMSHWKALYGADILDFDYDAFVREPRPSVERLLAFCGLEWEEALLCRSSARANAVKTASVWQVREPLYQRSSGRWRNYAAQIAPLRDYLRESRLRRDDDLKLRSSAVEADMSRPRVGHEPARLTARNGRVRIHWDSTHFSPLVGGDPACTVS